MRGLSPVVPVVPVGASVMVIVGPLDPLGPLGPLHDGENSLAQTVGLALWPPFVAAPSRPDRIIIDDSVAEGRHLAPHRAGLVSRA